MISLTGTEQIACHIHVDRHKQKHVNNCLHPGYFKGSTQHADRNKHT